VGTAGQREGEWAHAREPAPTGRSHGAVRERQRGRGVSTLVGADRRGPPVMHRGCAGAGWAKWGDLG
jgi:hypothetical protein